MLRREVKARALRILDAIANACAARGYEADLPRQRSGHRHVNGHLEVTINGHPNVIKLDELNDRVPHEPTTQELRDKERYSWTRIPTHDQVPSGRLRLKLLNGCAI